jgi:hypothetical protein
MQRALTPVLVTMLFIGVVEYLVGWGSIFYPWRFIDSLWTIIGPALLVLLTYVVRALRLYRYFQMERDFLLCLRLLLQHNALLNLLPMRTGEIAFPVLMNKYFSVPPSQTVPALLWLRILDMHALGLVLIMVVGALVAPGLVALLSAVWISGLFLVFSGSKRLADFLVGRDAGPMRLLRNALSAVPRREEVLVESWLLTALNWLMKLGAVGWLIKEFGSMDFMVAMAGAVFGATTTMLPIHGFAGVGTYELGAVAAMQAFQVSAHDALTGAANSHLFILGVSIAGGLASQLIAAPASARRVEALLARQDSLPAPTAAKQNAPQPAVTQRYP